MSDVSAIGNRPVLVAQGYLDKVKKEAPKDTRSAKPVEVKDVKLSPKSIRVTLDLKGRKPENYVVMVAKIDTSEGVNVYYYQPTQGWKLGSSLAKDGSAKESFRNYGIGSRSQLQIFLIKKDGFPSGPGEYGDFFDGSQSNGWYSAWHKFNALMGFLKYEAAIPPVARKAGDKPIIDAKGVAK